MSKTRGLAALAAGIAIGLFPVAIAFAQNAPPYPAAGGGYVLFDQKAAGAVNPLPVTCSSGCSAGTAAAVAPAGSGGSLVSSTVDAGAHNLLDFTMTIGATSGYAQIFDAASLPSNGPVAPARCWPVKSDGTSGFLGVSFGASDDKYLTGVVIAFSTGADCIHLTASPTAFITRRVQ